MNFANVKEWRILEGDVLQVTDSQNRIIWKKDTGPDYSEPFYVENISNSEETLNIVGGISTATQNRTIEYSTDKTTWQTLGTTSTTPLTKTLQPGDKIYLRCNTTTWADVHDYHLIFGISKVGGNIMSLLYYDNFEDKISLPGTYTFYGLFSKSNTGNKLIDASKLLLPATTLTERCYNTMFSNCSSLTTPPVLPSTTLAKYCYYFMFYKCTSLTTAPALPATTLSRGCYAGMFEGCTSLTTAPQLNSTNLQPGCYSSMFAGCTSLTTAPALPATTLSRGCYASMFEGCTSLTTAPVLPATTLIYHCYEYMFYNCSRLNYIKCLATTNIYVDDATLDWVKGVSSTGTFVRVANATWFRGDDGVPNNWTVINE